MADTVFDGNEFFDIRKVLARIEALEKLRQPGPVTLEADSDDLRDDYDPDEFADEDTAQDDLFAELATLEAFAAEVAGNGGDHEWRGAWYPITFHREDKFEDYAREFAEDMHGEALRSAAWPMNHIDWDAATDALRIDYSEVELNGTTYLYR